MQEDFDAKSAYSAYTQKIDNTERSSVKASNKKKYQVRVEIRCSNQEIMDLIRNDIESLIVDDLS